MDIAFNNDHSFSLNNSLFIDRFVEVKKNIYYFIDKNNHIQNMNNFIINRISKSKFDRYNDDLYDDDKYFKDIPYDHKIIVRLNYL